MPERGNIPRKTKNEGVGLGLFFKSFQNFANKMSSNFYAQKEYFRN